MLPPTRAIDHALWMLNADANRKRLGLHRYRMAVQHSEGVARAVAKC